MIHKESPDSLEVGEDDQTDDQGDNGQAVTNHGQVVETDGKLQGGGAQTQKSLTTYGFILKLTLKFTLLCSAVRNNF